MDKVEFFIPRTPPPPLFFLCQTYVGCGMGWRREGGGVAAPGRLKDNIMFGEIKDKGRAGTLKAPLNLSSHTPSALSS